MPDIHVQSKVILTNTDGNILLLRRSPKSHTRPNEWDLVGGGVDADETLEQAASRELTEETGILSEITVHDTVFATSKKFDEPLAVDGISLVTWFFYYHQVQKQEMTLSNEHTDAAWVPFAQAVTMINYDIQLAALNFVHDAGLLSD